MTHPRALPRALAFALGLTLLFAAPAFAQTYTPTVDASPDLGIIVPAATTSTTFSFASSSGTVSQSGSAVRRTSGTTRAQVTIGCTGSGNACADAITVKIGSTGTPTGKAGAMGAFNVTAAANGGTISGSSGTNPLSFTITPKNKNTSASFYIGGDFPITANNSAGTSGAATSQFYVYVAHSPTVPTTGTAVTATATTYRGIAFSGTPTMKFGTISKPATGTSTTATLGPSSDTVSFSGGVTSTASGTINRASFNLTGESSMAITVTVDSSFAMNRTGGGSLTVTTNNTGLPTALSGGTTGSQGTASFYVGGSFPLDSNTAVGVYSGSFNVTAAYN